MSKNTGLAYEKLVQTIFDQIVNQDLVETVQVQQNVLLEGRDTTHQIDVYWKFVVGGITHEVIVQAKDWASPVKQEQLLTFKSVLSDLPGQPRGIFVTKTGYQSGAKRIAETNGIALFELREPTDKDFEGWLSRITINITFLNPQPSDISIDQDAKWVHEERLRIGFEPDEPIPLSVEGTARFEDDKGDDIGSLSDLLVSYYPGIDSDERYVEVRHEFQAPTYLLTGSPAFPKLKVSALSFKVTVHEMQETIDIHVRDAVGFILRNVLDESELTFDKQARLRPPSI